MPLYIVLAAAGFAMATQATAPRWLLRLKPFSCSYCLALWVGSVVAAFAYHKLPFIDYAVMVFICGNLSGLVAALITIYTPLGVDSHED